MQLPYFFEEALATHPDVFELSPETARHVVQVLRMKENDELLLTNGKGLEVQAKIIQSGKRNVQVEKKVSRTFSKDAHEKAIAISLLKNESRFEWFLEKATEIGINRIIPLLCKRTERRTMRVARMKNILTSAMLQSRQVFLPQLDEVTALVDLSVEPQYKQKFIAHCIDNSDRQELKNLKNNDSSGIVLIGPEGDFDAEEIEFCLQRRFLPVSLGTTRLRTETAGIVAAVLLKF